MTSRMSAKFVVTADLETNTDFVNVLTSSASVVFPHPGGPQKIIEGTN